jgi:hypothetical protein
MEGGRPDLVFCGEEKARRRRMAASGAEEELNNYEL